LISAKFTRAEKLGMYGGSNGGLLVGSVLAQRPDLFGAAVISSALLDMLRYHLFDTAKVWINEYGVARRKNDFQILRAYSPLHNLNPAKYPATLVFTGGDDDRVSPAHSYKFVSQLQRAQRGSAPILLKVEEQSGHSLRNDTSYWMDMLSFFAHHLGLRTEAF
jgi:prolyl oligopeptidase